MERTAQRKDWIDSNGKMETKHPVKEPFGSKFPAICNHCGTYDGLKSQDLEIFLAICAFFNTISLKLSLLRLSCRNLPGPAPIFGSYCSRFHPNWFTLGGVIAEHVKTVFAP